MKDKEQIEVVMKDGRTVQMSMEDLHRIAASGKNFTLEISYTQRFHIGGDVLQDCLEAIDNLEDWDGYATIRDNKDNGRELLSGSIRTVQRALCSICYRLGRNE